LSSNPGRIAAEIPISLPRTRNRLDEEFHSIVDEIYAVLTARTVASIGALSQVHGGLGQPLPQASLNRIIGLIQTLIAPPYDGQAELATLARSLSLEVDDLFPIAEALHILEFGELKGGAVKLTAAGRVFAKAISISANGCSKSTCSGSSRSPRIFAGYSPNVTTIERIVSGSSSSSKIT
jgi:NitT/TauT family transport system ATP-binding protein